MPFDDDELGAEGFVFLPTDSVDHPSIQTSVTIRRSSLAAFQAEPASNDLAPQKPYEMDDFGTEDYYALPRDFMPSRVSSTKHCEPPAEFNPYTMWKRDPQ